MLRRVFEAEDTYYCWQTDRLECFQDNLMFFGVSAKQTDNLRCELELGYAPDCKTEELDSIIQMSAQELDSDRTFQQKRPLYDPSKPLPFKKQDPPPQKGIQCHNRTVYEV